MIYVVDDNVSVCRALDRLLRSAELDVETFTSAKEFLCRVRPDESDCLVVDVQMPDMSGLDLQEKLSVAGIQIPIIFITAFDDDRTRTKARRGGAVGYFRKPFDDQAMLNAINFATGGKDT